MITRIVKMTFRPETVAEFITLFTEQKTKIKGFPGCHHLELLQENSTGHVFFTYSTWENEKALEAYRHSELFKTVWKATKQLFAEKAAAWSTEKRAVLTDLS